MLTIKYLDRRRVTIYMPTMSGILKIEASAFASAVAPHAQYRSAVHYAYVRRGERRARSCIKGYRPSMLILDGWGHPDVQAPPEAFDAAMSAHIKATAAIVVADYRGHDSQDGLCSQ
jgi:hypothetical protein